MIYLIHTFSNEHTDARSTGSRSLCAMHILGGRYKHLIFNERRECGHIHIVCGTIQTNGRTKMQKILYERL